MKKKTLIITSVLAVGLLGFAGYQASAIYTSAGDGEENALRLVEESAVSLAKSEKNDNDEKQTQPLAKSNVERDDSDDDDEQTNENAAKENLIAPEKAIAIAKKKYAGKITEIDFDHDDGKQLYEIEMLTKRGEVELEIDAKTGKIISVDFDD